MVNRAAQEHRTRITAKAEIGIGIERNLFIMLLNEHTGLSKWAKILDIPVKELEGDSITQNILIGVIEQQMARCLNNIMAVDLATHMTRQARVRKWTGQSKREYQDQLHKSIDQLHKAFGSASFGNEFNGSCYLQTIVHMDIPGTIGAKSWRKQLHIVREIPNVVKREYEKELAS